MACPAMKRRLEGGETGSDVKATQRALQKALASKGLPSGLSPTGTWGSGSETDCKRWQQAVGIAASGAVGQPTLDSLWRHVDAYGTSLYYRAVIGQPTKLPSPIKYGASGDRVRAAQQALWRALGPDSRNSRNGTYGSGMKDDLKVYCARADWKGASGELIEQPVWDALWGFMDDYARKLAKSAGSTGGAGGPDAIRSSLITWAEWYVARGGSYAQLRPYQRDVPAKTPLRNDCSGSAAHLLRLAGGPDPNGRNFDGHGYTGTMQGRGRKIDLAGAPGNLLPGDLIFYGDQGGGVAAHVELALDRGRLFGFGATPPTLHTYATYWTSGRRRDIGARRYF